MKANSRRDTITNSVLSSEMRWIKWIVHGSTLILLSAIVYFNNKLHDEIITSRADTVAVHDDLMKSKSEHELGLVKLEHLISSFELLCCSEVTDKGGKE